MDVKGCSTVYILNRNTEEEEVQIERVSFNVFRGNIWYSFGLFYLKRLCFPPNMNAA